MLPIKVNTQSNISEYQSSHNTNTEDPSYEGLKEFLDLFKDVEMTLMAVSIHEDQSSLKSGIELIALDDVASVSPPESIRLFSTQSSNFPVYPGAIASSVNEDITDQWPRMTLDSDVLSCFWHALKWLISTTRTSIVELL